jgi:hypothetical protein
MIQHGHQSVLPSGRGSTRAGPISLRNKNESPLPHMLIRPAPEAAWLLIHPPPSPTALRLVAALCPTPIVGHATCLRFMCHSPALLTCIPVTCVARSLAVRPSPIAIRRPADPAMAAGARVTSHLGSSPTEPKAPTSATGAGSACAPPDPTPMTRIDQPPYFPPLCCKFILKVFKMFQRFVTIVTHGCC